VGESGHGRFVRAGRAYSRGRAVALRIARDAARLDQLTPHDPGVAGLDTGRGLLLQLNQRQ